MTDDQKECSYSTNWKILFFEIYFFFFYFIFYCKKYNTKQSIWVILDFNDGE